MYFKYTYLVSIFCTLCGIITAEKMRVNIYYETYDQSCVKFFTDQFRDAYDSLNNYIEVNLVPYGNSQITKTINGSTVSCKHGEVECHANKVHACVRKLTPNDNFHQMQFVICTMENVDLRQPSPELYPVKKCMESTKSPAFMESAVQTCVNDPNEALTMECANETRKLGSFDRLPIITLNNEPYMKEKSDKLVSNLMSELCAELSHNYTYQIPACSATQMNTTPYGGNATKSTTTPSTPSSSTHVSIMQWLMVVTSIFTLYLSKKY